MDEMKGDMGGAAAVAGAMKAIAQRKAKANVVGVVALVENMPGANAQRPGDIVNTMSGQTIEVLNTDAEGRLILADAVWYAQDKFEPSAVIDLATLTGAVVVALGHENGGDVLERRRSRARHHRGRSSRRRAGVAHAAQRRLRQADRHARTPT